MLPLVPTAEGFIRASFCSTLGRSDGMGFARTRRDGIRRFAYSETQDKNLRTK